MAFESNIMEIFQYTLFPSGIICFLPASPKAKAGLGVGSVCPSQNLVIATSLKLLIQLSQETLVHAPKLWAEKNSMRALIIVSIYKR